MMTMENYQYSATSIEFAHSPTLPSADRVTVIRATEIPLLAIEEADVFRHIVLLTLATDAPVELIVAELEGLPALIPELRSYSVGRDAGLAADNATLAVVAVFEDQAGYEVYRDHPQHVRVITDHIRPVLEARAAHQHWFDAPVSIGGSDV